MAGQPTPWVHVPIPEIAGFNSSAGLIKGNQWFSVARQIRPAISGVFLRGVTGHEIHSDLVPRNLQQDPLKGPLNLSI